ncbi:exodeoxyribonuclease V subunit beta [Occultella glacieicola]|uniref:RecBCD enzyme subunit RecB n=1 Tax=Occultella glacieicola TaxID=2518684 RepID=A0ABY2E9J9_9MICO|nr:exodeoxyribonuclease V subunit beta [Occultella glacieicola]
MSQDFSITDPLPSGTVLLEASAGTGKTWTIAALVARYVAEGRAQLTEMLIITFGRAASQELRARVREQLVQVERALQHPQPAAGAPGPLIDLLLDVDEAERDRRLGRVRRALTSFDEATIATTHQFCHQVLRSLGVAGTSDASAQLVEDLDELLVEVVDDLYLRGFVGSRQAPFFSRRQALDIARAVVDDVHAELRPDPDTGDRRSEPVRRARFAQAVRAELERRKRRLQVMHYNDLLTQLAGALAVPDSLAAQRMRTRWKVVLVDEFQDTDPIQWQVLERAFAGHATMVLIGDPKQAIYAFRGGDVVTYLKAAAHAQDRRTLPTNHRSDAPVVDALQGMLRGAALGDTEIAVVPVRARRQGSRLHGLPRPGPVRLRQVLRKQHLGGSAAIGATRDHISRDLALDIAELLASGATFDDAPDLDGDPLPPRPIQARDIAVLAHTNRDLLAAQKELRRLGIHAVSAGGGSVLRSRAAHDWLALLEAMAAPHRATLTRASALTDLGGMTAVALDAGGDDLDDELSARHRRLADVYDRQGAAAVLEAVGIEGLSARTLAHVGGERTLTDLQHVGELLHETSQQPGGGRLGLAGLIEWLRAQMADDAVQASGARTRRLDSDAAAVQLVTIHSSKGLQYPIVYCPALFDRHVAKTPDIPQFHEADGARTRCRDVGGETDNQGWSDSVARHKAEEAGEALRLLYVAVTRAQSQVVMWWSPTNNTPNSALHRLLFGRDPDGVAVVPDAVPTPRSDDLATAKLRAWADHGAFALEAADHAAVVPAPPAAPVPELSIRGLDRAIDTGWRRTSYTALSTPKGADGPEPGGVGSEPDLTPRDDEPDTPQPVLTAEPTLPGLDTLIPGADVPSPMAHLPVGATFGSLVHGVLEHADPQARDLRAELLGQIREQLVWWPVDLEPEDLADALVAVCDSPLGPLAPGLTLRDIGSRDRLCELDFELPLGGGDVRGVGPRGRLGDLAPLLRRHLKAGDPVRDWADVLDSQPMLAQQELSGYLTGSVDVVLRTSGTAGTYLVVDYKTNWLGPFNDPEQPLTAAAYRPEALAEAMGHSSYPLQALLYAVVAHRFLRWRLRDYDPRKHLGGVLYLYVRGMCGPQTPVIDSEPCGVFSWRPPVALVQDVSDLLDGLSEGAA